MTNLSNPIRILVADEDESILNLYRQTISREGENILLAVGSGDLTSEVYEKMPDKIDLVCCQKGEDAIELIRQAVSSGMLFAIAFIDIHIPPGPDGIRIAENIRQLDPNIEIVMVSRYPQLNSIEIARRIPPAHKLLFIRKPFHLQEILQSSSALISKWLLEREVKRIQSELEEHVEERTSALQKERNFISAILDTAGALIVVLDKNECIVRFNRACEELSGYMFEEVSGKHIRDLFPVPEEVLPIHATFEDMPQHQNWRHNGATYENFWTTKDGRRRLIAWSYTSMTELDYGIWIGLDITERKKMEEELRLSEERYRALIENVNDGVAVIQDEKLIFVNEAFSSMFGYEESSELVGQNVISLIDSHFEAGFTKFLNTALDKGSWGLPFRGKCVAKDGREFWAEKRSSIITHEAHPAILITVRDITDNMLWEQTIKQEAEYFRSESVKLKSSIGDRYRLLNIIGKSPVMQDIYELILKAAATDANVIILGKSGTGKELAARAVHKMSDRASKPFVAVNCGAIPENLIESEFFGYKKGAFTGAYADKKGYLHEADSGTLFLDEVGDIGLNMQVKLLRVLEGGEYMPVGDIKTRTADIRIIAATNKEPLEMVKRGQMREDFFYRISVIPITMPPLKDRKEDIPLLVEHFLRSFSDGKNISTLPVNIMDALLNYNWPGNVRELQNVLQRYLTVKSLDFMKISTTEAPNPMPDAEIELKGDIQKTLDNIEKQIIIRALEKYRWSRTQTAAVLGISRRSLFRRMKRLCID